MKIVIISIIIILFGIFMIWHTYKNPVMKKNGQEYRAGTAKGYTAGFIAILVGILTLLGYGDLASLLSD